MEKALEWWEDHEIGKRLEQLIHEIENVNYAEAFKRLQKLLGEGGLRDSQNYCWVPYPIRCLVTVKGNGEWHLHCMLTVENAEEFISMAWVEKHYCAP